MSDPDRLFTGGGADAFEKELLASWSNRQPTKEAEARVLALAMGAGAVVVAASGSIPAKAIAASGFSLVKWIGLGALALGVAATTFYVTHSAKPGTPVGSVSTPPLESVHLIAPSVPAPAPSAIATTITPEISLDSIAPASPKSAPSAARSTLADELARIDRAQRANSSGDSAAALRLVDEYDATYPNGTLAQESAAIRIEALARRGDRSAAEKLANAFLAAHPTSPHARRIRELVARP